MFYLVGAVALADQGGLCLNKLIAVWVKLQADSSPHISRIHLNMLPCLKLLAMPHVQIVGSLRKEGLLALGPIMISMSAIMEA